MATRKRGRPKKGDGEALAATIRVRVRPDEKAAMEVEAKMQGLGLSEWARRRLLPEPKD